MKRLFGTDKKISVQQYQRSEDFGTDCQAQLVPGLSNLYSPQISDQTCVQDLADILSDMGKLTAPQLDDIRRRQDSGIGKLDELILETGLSEEDILTARAQLHGLAFRQLKPEDIDRAAFAKLDIDYIRKNHIIPIEMDSQVLVVATCEPANVFMIDDVKRHSGMDVSVVVCSSSNIEAICDELDDSQFNDLDEIISDMTEIELVQDDEENAEDLEKSAGESPVIKYVNYLLSNAVHEGASDIHIEPKEKYTRIRYRIDGVLFDMKQAPAKMHQAVISRLKIMSNLDISERRLPQDGKISVIMGSKAIDLRVSILPTNHGEKAVIRILDRESIQITLEEMGMEPSVLKAFKNQIALPHGIFLVTGPTGSGKSTTLYTALGHMDGNRMNISTVEDPVEYELEFCNQVQVNERINLTFSAALRSLLRQDPDIVMIGEIRDKETARIATQAALTGHLVLSTLHTNDAPSSISRLVNIGVEPYLIAASLNGVLAQRLVRRICPDCKQHYKAPESALRYAKAAGIKPSQLMHGAGCDACKNSGYAGRAGIFEMLTIDNKFKNLINKDASADSMKRAFAENGWPSLFDDGMKKVRKGLTTIEEVLRITQAYEQNENNASASITEDKKKKAVKITKTKTVKQDGGENA
jgi:type IV pilus assembly protein PilB